MCHSAGTARALSQRTNCAAGPPVLELVQPPGGHGLGHRRHPGQHDRRPGVAAGRRRCPQHFSACCRCSSFALVMLRGGGGRGGWLMLRGSDRGRGGWLLRRGFDAGGPRNWRAARFEAGKGRLGNPVRVVRAPGLRRLTGTKRRSGKSGSGWLCAGAMSPVDSGQAPCTS